MAFEFKLPDLGEGIVEGEIVKWRVRPGDQVEEHQVVLEVETDKAVVEVPSPKKGLVKGLARGEGETVQVGETLLVLDTGEEPVSEAAAPAPGPEKKDAVTESVTVVGRMPSAEDVLAPPRVRAIAKRLGVDLGGLSGTGPGGVITEADVRAAAGPAGAAPPAPAPPPAPPAPGAPAVAPEAGAGKDHDRYGPVERVPIRGVRKTIARNLLASQSRTASVTGMDEADVTRLWGLRAREKGVAEGKDVHLTFLPFFMKAVWHALQVHPMLNGSVAEDGSEIIIKKYFNIGVAVDTPDGLMVAVVRDVDKKTILALAAELTELNQKAVERKITLEELKGSTFTITNYGSHFGTFATPIINPPDIAILGTGRIADRPWVVEGEIKIRKILPLSLTFDHRVIDGVESARFLARVIGYLEDPGEIFIESV